MINNPDFGVTGRGVRLPVFDTLRISSVPFGVLVVNSFVPSGESASGRTRSLSNSINEGGLDCACTRRSRYEVTPTMDTETARVQAKNLFGKELLFEVVCIDERLPADFFGHLMGVYCEVDVEVIVMRGCSATAFGTLGATFVGQRLWYCYDSALQTRLVLRHMS